MKKNFNKDIGLMSDSGICIDGDIMLSCEHEHTNKAYLPLRIILAFIATFSTSVIAENFLRTDMLSSVLFFYSVFYTVSLGLLKSKYTIIKVCAAVASLLELGTILLKYEKIYTGACIAVWKYMTRAGLPASTLGAKLTDSVMEQQHEYIFCLYQALIFFIAVGTVIACVYRIDFPLLFIFTFPLFEIGMYWGWESSTPAVIGLIVSWITVLVVHIINHTTNKAGINNTFAVHERKKTFYFTSNNAKAMFYPIFISFTAILTAVVFIVIIIFSAVTGFVRPKKFDIYRTNISRSVSNFSLSNLSNALADYDGGFDLFGVQTVGGTNGGVLGTSEGISFNGSTALKIKSGKFDCTMYLRGYVAGVYYDNRWDPVENSKELKEITKLFDEQGLWCQDYDYFAVKTKNIPVLENSIDNMEVSVKNASKKFVYAPYGTRYTNTEHSKKKDIEPYFDSYVWLNKFTYELPYYEYSKLGYSNWQDISDQLEWYDNSGNSELNTAMKRYEDFVNDNYTEYVELESLEKVYREIVRNYLDGNADGHDYHEVYQAIKTYFSDNFTYTITPGATPSGEDFIDYFLTTQKEGYCSYFATTGAELLRMFGYPSRFVEGYMILPSQQTQPDNDGRYSVTVTDRAAHAWAEVFISGCGWMPAEFTPGYDNNNPNMDEKEKDPDSVATSVTTKVPEPDESSDASETTKVNGQNGTATTTGKKDSSSGGNNAGKVTSVTGKNNSEANNGTTKKTSPGTSSESHKKKPISPGVKALLMTIFITVIICIVLILHRDIKLKTMKEKCYSDDLNERVLDIFRYSLKYMSLIGVECNNNISDLQLCKVLIEKCHEKNINELDESLEELCDIAVCAFMSDKSITEDQAEKAAEVLRYISEDILPTKLSKMEKLSAKWIWCLY